MVRVDVLWNGIALFLSLDATLAQVVQDSKILN
jgi:hypothetical protein